MLSLNDIINVSFRKSGFSGYRAEDVDAFIDQVRESFDELQKKGIEKDEQLEHQKEEAKQADEKLKILAGKIEEYRAQEDEIKNALISAQKLGDASVREARHKSEIILKDANLKAEHIVSGANDKIKEQKEEMNRLKREVSDFRSKLLSAYKEHLTLIDALPSERPEPASDEKAPPAAPAEPADEPPAAPAPAAQEPGEESKPEDSDDTFQAEISYFDDDEPQK